MLNTIRKITLCLMAIILTAGLVCSCNESKTKSIAMSISDDDGKVRGELSEGLFSYLASSQKSYYLMSFIGRENYSANASAYDTPEFWNQIDQDGEVTLGEHFFSEACIDEAKKLLVCEYIFDIVYGLQAPNEVDEKISSTVKTLEKSLGSASALENYLLGFGATIEDFKHREMLEYKRSMLKNFIFDKEKGLAPTSDEEIKEYFKENYAIVKHILINDAYITKDDGSVRGLTDEEKAQKASLVASINARMQAGESFEELAEEYKDGDAYGYVANPHGYFVTENNKYLPEFQKASLEMKVGEIRTVKTEYGTHIIKKYPMNEELFSAYDDVYSEIKASIETKLFDEFVKLYFKNITVNEEVTDSYSVTSIPLVN